MKHMPPSSSNDTASRPTLPDAVSGVSCPPGNASFSRKKLLFPSRSLAILFLGLMALFVGTAIFEYRARKAEISELLREEALLLVQALSQGTDSALTGTNAHYDQLLGRLYDQLQMAQRLDTRTALSAKTLSDLVDPEGPTAITLFDQQGNMVMSSHDIASDGAAMRFFTPDRFQPLLAGQLDHLLFGLAGTKTPTGPRLYAAILRHRNGVIAGSIDAASLLSLRRESGAGRFMQRLAADREGIDYIIWQDATAILAATSNVRAVPPIRQDPFLRAVLAGKEPATRFFTFDGREVFEVVKPFFHQGVQVGIIRTGLRSDHFTLALTKLRNRMVMMLVLLGFGGLVLFNLMMTRKNESLMQQAYEREQTFSSTILEQMADAVVVVNEQGRITQLNRAAEQLFQRNATEVAGQPAGSLVAEFDTIFQSLLQNAKPSLSQELEVVVDGRTLQLSGRFNPLAADAGEGTSGAIGVFRDLTEQRALQRMIDRQEKLTAMGELASGVAHEIRNPLNAIGIIAQRLDFEFNPETDQEEYHQLLGSVVSEVHRVNGIIQRFLKFARPAPLELQEGDLDAFIAARCPLLQGEADARGLHFSCETNSQSMVMLDEAQMLQVLLNLVRNAAEATQGTGGAISLKTYVQEQHACISVSDTGPGIPPEAMRRIFNLYYTTKSDGTGMGLSIANQIVQGHGGTIVVEAVLPHGACFLVKLPFAAQFHRVC